jgi:peptidoglycan-N-acetylglucosamine deacetylase
LSAAVKLAESGPMRVALTFDAEHPDLPRSPSQNAETILDHLATREIRASFFLQGRWVTAYPETAQRIADEGHLVGSHSLGHTRFTWLTEEGIARDLLEARDAIVRTVGRETRPWFRLPFGDGRDDELVHAVLNVNGYRHVDWDVNPYDWRPGRSPASIERAVIDGICVGSAVVVFHAWPEATAQALPAIIERLGEKGAEFVTVDELEHGESRQGLDPYAFDPSTSR